MVAISSKIRSIMENQYQRICTNLTIPFEICISIYFVYFFFEDKLSVMVVTCFYFYSYFPFLYMHEEMFIYNLYTSVFVLIWPGIIRFESFPLNCFINILLLRKIRLNFICATNSEGWPFFSTVVLLQWSEKLPILWGFLTLSRVWIISFGWYCTYTISAKIYSEPKYIPKYIARIYSDR